MPRKRDGLYPNAVIPPLDISSTYYFENTADVIAYHQGRNRLGRYARYDNPNWVYFERAFAQLEDADEALLFPSGMSAISATILALLSSEAILLYFGKGYRNIRTLCEDLLPGLGVRTIAVDLSSQDAFKESMENAPKDRDIILFIEAPTNPLLLMVDFSHLEQHDFKSLITIVDSTLASPINFQPLQHGASLVVHSASKYIGGHTDLMAGVVAGDAALIDRIRQFRNVTGSIATSATAVQLSRSLETLALRMSKHNENGAALAEFLRSHEAVSKVWYTALPTHPSFASATRLLSGHGSVVSFEILGGREEASDLVDRLTVPFMATNFGGQYSLVEQVRIFTYYHQSDEQCRRLGIAESLIRLSIGLNELEQLQDDLNVALTNIRR
jgi:cystathionine gamma-synthase